MTGFTDHAPDAESSFPPLFRRQWDSVRTVACVMVER